jgi:hypothetical protein
MSEFVPTAGGQRILQIPGTQTLTQLMNQFGPVVLLIVDFLEVMMMNVFLTWSFLHVDVCFVPLTW